MSLKINFFKLFIIKLINTTAMANELKRVIREAFNIAYINKKLQSLNEDAREKGEALGADKAKADEVLAKVINNPSQAINYPWLMKSKSGLSDEQSNYIVDSLVELYKSTGEDKYKEAIANMFSPAPIVKTGQNMIDKRIKEKSVTNTAAYNEILSKARQGSPLESLNKKDPDFAYTAMLRAWGRLFKGGTIIPKGTDTKVDAFDNILKRYTGSGQGFGGAIIEAMANDVKNEARREARRQGRFVAPPTNRDGKEIDLGDEYGSGAEGAESEAGSEFEDDDFSDDDF
jgi:hypothetical protein